MNGLPIIRILSLVIGGSSLFNLIAVKLFYE